MSQLNMDFPFSSGFILYDRYLLPLVRLLLKIWLISPGLRLLNLVLSIVLGVSTPSTPNTFHLN